MIAIHGLLQGLRGRRWPAAIAAPRRRKVPLAWKIIIGLAAFLLAWLWDQKAAAESPAPAPETARPGAPLLFRDLGWSAVERWRARPGKGEEPPGAGVESMRILLYDIVLGTAGIAGPSEDPRKRLEAIVSEMFDRRGYRVLPEPAAGYGPEHLLLDEVLRRRAGSPSAVAGVCLAVAELLSPPLELQPAAVPGGALVCSRDGGVALNLFFSPRSAPRLVREIDLARLGAGEPAGAASAEVRLRLLTRPRYLAEILVDLAQAARGRKEFEAEAWLLSAAVEKDPLSVRGWLGLARAGRESGDRERERSAVEAALLADPEDPGALARQGILRHEAGDLAAAEGSLRRAVEREPSGDPTRLLLLGEISRDRGRTGEAIRWYRRYLDTGPSPESRAVVEEEIRDLEIVPAVGALRGGDYAARMEALRKVAGAGTAGGTRALIEAMKDPNLRFARLAWKALRSSTGQDLEFDPAVWEGWASARGRPEAGGWRLEEEEPSVDLRHDSVAGGTSWARSRPSSVVRP